MKQSPRPLTSLVARARLLAVLALTGAAMPSVSQAQTKQQIDWCYSEEATDDQTLEGCTAMINSGRYTGVELSHAYDNRGYGFNHKGQYDSAIPDFDEAVRLDPNNYQAFNNRGNAYTNKGQYDRAIPDYDQALRINPNYALSYSNRGNAYRLKGQYDRAIQDYNKAIQINPNYARAYYYRGITKQKKGDIAGGNADIARAKQLNPHIAD